MTSKSEDALVAEIRARLATEHSDVAVGIGDDAAVLGDDLVVSVDAAVEGTHFERAWLTLADIGRRGTIAALSDLAAMGASPLAVLSSVVAPSAEDTLEVMTGVGEAADAVGAAVVGGNVARAPHLALHTTVIGRARAAWTRAGARVGDAIYVTGPVGGAAVGWRSLSAGVHAPRFARRWREPTARFDLIPHLSPSACIDISDGVALDLARLCEGSRVGACVELSRLPFEPGFRAAAAAVGEDPDRLALEGGEDYELLFTMPASLDPEIATRIGKIEAEPGVRILRRDGSLSPSPGGHRHF